MNRSRVQEDASRMQSVDLQKHVLKKKTQNQLEEKQDGTAVPAKLNI